MQKEMLCRKLQPSEHIRTRKLWEEIFTEDTPEFLDYYYSIKIKNNENFYEVDENGKETEKEIKRNKKSLHQLMLEGESNGC